MPDSFKETIKAHAKPYFGEPLPGEAYQFQNRVFKTWQTKRFDGVTGFYQGEIDEKTGKPDGRGIVVTPNKDIKIGRFN